MGKVGTSDGDLVVEAGDHRGVTVELVLPNRRMTLNASQARSFVSEIAKALYVQGEHTFTDFGDFTPRDRAEPTQGEAGMTAMAPTPAPRFPHLGSDVIYRSRTGDYSLAAKVARNAKSSSPEALHRGVEAGRLFMVPLTLLEVDLTVFTPGGSYVEGEPSQWTGTYAEHAIKYSADGEPGTWCWFDELVRRGVEL